MTRWYPNLGSSVHREVQNAIRRILGFIYETRDALGPRALYARATEQLAIGTTRSAIQGCSLTLDRAGWWLITGTWTIIIDGDGAKLFTGYLKVNREVQLQRALLEAADATTVTIAQQWFLKAEPNTVITLEIDKESTATGDSTAEKEHCTLAAVWSGK